MTPAPAARSPVDQLPGGVPGLRVEPRRGLVEEHQLRPADHGRGERQPLLLAAGQPLERRPPGPGQAEPVQQQPRIDRVGVEPGQHAQVLTGPGRGRDAAGLQHHADFRPQLAGVADRIEAEHPDHARVRPPVALADLDRRGLARAVGPEDGRHLRALGAQRQACHRSRAAVALEQPVISRAGALLTQASLGGLPPLHRVTVLLRIRA